MIIIIVLLLVLVSARFAADGAPDRVWPRAGALPDAWLPSLIAVTCVNIHTSLNMLFDCILLCNIRITENVC